ncbi:hypothetical protein ACIHDR_46880 [Nocardia sp. NPDC052278]|uniref:hypothetical protein n=1 Tax=unclassified Nocardia TaxID=2637762 RepID=UPI00367B8590
MRTILDSGFRPPHLHDLSAQLLVITAQTGDEWRSTCDLAEEHVLPLLRQHNIRTVEVARAGPRREDGIHVLQDTRQPTVLHPHSEKIFALSTEHRDNGVMPTLNSRSCSEKAKGWPLDTWRAGELGDRPYFHAIGYNVDLCRRIVMCPLSIRVPLVRGPNLGGLVEGGMACVRGTAAGMPFLVARTASTGHG